MNMEFDTIATYTQQTHWKHTQQLDSMIEGV